MEMSAVKNKLTNKLTYGSINGSISKSRNESISKKPTSKQNKLFLYRKGDMNWMMIMLLLALVVLLIMGFILKGMTDKFTQSTGKITEKTNTQLDKVTDDLFQDTTDAAGKAYDYVSGKYNSGTK